MLLQFYLMTTIKKIITIPAGITCPKSTIETIEQGLKYV